MRANSFKWFTAGVFAFVLAGIAFTAGVRLSPVAPVPPPAIAPDVPVAPRTDETLETPSTAIVDVTPIVTPASETISPLENTTRVEFKQSNDGFTIPEVTITGSGKVPPGEVVIMTASMVPTEHLKRATFSWAVFDAKLGRRERVATFPDNTQIIFGAGLRPTKFLVTFQASFIFEKTEVVEVVKSVDPPVTEKVTVVTRSDLMTTGITEYLVQVEGETPEPEPEPDTPPDPKPTPDPVFPDGRFGLSKIFYQSVKQNVVSKKFIPEVAANFGSIASAIAAGGIKEPEKALAELAAANKQTLSTADAAVKTEWTKVLGADSTYQNTLFSLNESGKLKTVEDFRAAFKEIEEGIRAVK